MISVARFLQRHAIPAFLISAIGAGLPQLAPDAAAATPQTWTFGYVGPGVQHFTVPNGVTQLSAIVTGAAGGQTNNQIATPGGGAVTIATLAVTPGQQFTIWVGGNGNGDDGKGRGGWGFGCGGARGTTANSGTKNGGGGGGGSAIVLGSYTNNDCDAVASVTSAPVLIVAGGGGGGGGYGALNGAFTNKVNNTGGAGGAGGDIGSQGANGNSSPGPGVTLGGCGGNAAGTETCNTASSTPTGNSGGSAPAGGGGGGGGGGGYFGGGGGVGGLAYGGPPAFSPGGGGGGGLSVASTVPAISDVAFLSGGPGAPNLGVAPGLNGSVVLTTNKVEGFAAGVASFDPPAGTTQMTVYLEGASGGNRTNAANTLVNSAFGSPGGSMKATFPFVSNQQPYWMIVGGYGNQHGGGGYGEGGDQGQVGGDSDGFDGGGGGGAALESTDPAGGQIVLLDAGGGGGGGGNGVGSAGGGGGAWCAGNGAPGNDEGGHGGEGGAAATPTRDHGAAVRPLRRAPGPAVVAAAATRKVAGAAMAGVEFRSSAPARAVAAVAPVIVSTTARRSIRPRGSAASPATGSGSSPSSPTRASRRRRYWRSRLC